MFEISGNTCLVLLLALFLLAVFKVNFFVKLNYHFRTFFHHERKKDLGLSEYAAPMTLAEALFHYLGCPYEKKENASSSDCMDYHFMYQNANFTLIAAKGGAYIVSLVYPSFAEYDLDKLDIVRTAVNNCNALLDVNVLFYTHSPETGKLSVHASASFPLVSGIPQTIDFFTYILDRFFEKKNAFQENYRSLYEDCDKKYFFDKDLDKFIDERYAYLSNEEELVHQGKEDVTCAREGRDVQLGALLKTLFGWKELDYIQLNVVTHELNTYLSGEIECFSVLSPLVYINEKGTPSFAEHSATLIATVENKEQENRTPENVTLTIVPDGETDSCLYFRVTACREFKAIRRHDFPEEHYKEQGLLSRGLILTYDKVPDREKRIQYEFLRQEAMLLSEGELKEEMSPLHRYILDCQSINIGFNFYWGRVYFQRKAYYEALLHLESLWEYMNKYVVPGGKKETEAFNELTFSVGFCYLSLGRHKEAYYYLDALFTGAEKIEYQIQYINTLVAAKDYRAMMVVDTMLDRVRKHIAEYDEEENVPQNILNYYNFLKRREAYIYVDSGLWEIAEEKLNALAEDKENESFAISELAYLQKKRQEKEGENASSQIQPEDAEEQNENE